MAEYGLFKQALRTHRLTITDSNIKNSWLLKILDTVILPLLYIKDWGRKYTTYKTKGNINFKLRVNSSDLIAVWETWKGEFYNKIQIKDSDIIVDIGAHIGSYSIYASKKATNGKIYAFEASAENYEILKDNINSNNCSNITAKNYAVSSKSGKINFYTSYNKGMGSIIPGNGKKEEIKSITLSQILKGNKLNKIDILKIDAEGAEFDILLSSESQILNRLKNIILEYHEFKKSNRNLKTLINFLTIRGFKIKTYGPFYQKWLFGTGYICASRT